MTNYAIDIIQFTRNFIYSFSNFSDIFLPVSSCSLSVFLLYVYRLLTYFYMNWNYHWVLYV